MAARSRRGRPAPAGGDRAALAAAARLLRALDRTPIACVQNPQNLIHRASMPILQECSGRGIAFVPFFPLGSGFGQANPVLSNARLRSTAQRLGPRPGPDCACLAAGPGAHVLLIPGTYPGGTWSRTWRPRRHQAVRAHTGGTASGNTTACTCRPAAEPPTCGKSGRLVVGPWPWLQGPVDVPSVFDPQDDHLVEVVADPVEDPVSAASGGPYTSQVVT
jgi:hypothetical protein